MNVPELGPKAGASILHNSNSIYCHCCYFVVAVICVVIVITYSSALTLLADQQERHLTFKNQLQQFPKFLP